MDENAYVNLISRLDELRKQNSKAKPANTSSAGVALLKEKLIEAKAPLDRAALYQLLAQEYAMAGLVDQEIGTMRKAAAEFVNEPTPWISLAARLSLDEATLAESKEVIEQALAIAVKNDRFVRYALGTRARIANKLQAHELLADTIRKLIDDAATKRVEDCGFETDFLDSLPEKVIDVGIRQRYLQIAQSRRKPLSS
jgi:hypothetical protein